MRERAAQLGGTLAAGPDATGWRVTMRLPLGERAMSDAIRVLVADDQALVREGLMTLLATADGIEPVAAAARWRRGRRADRRAQTGRRADGPADAEPRRGGGDPADPRESSRNRGRGADDPRRRGVDPRRARRRRARLPDQGRRDRARSRAPSTPRRPTRRCSIRSCSSSCSRPRPPGRDAASQGEEAGGQARPPATLPDDLTPREAEVLTLIARRAIKPGDRRGAVRQRGDGEDAHQPRVLEDRRA